MEWGIDLDGESTREIRTEKGRPASAAAQHAGRGRHDADAGVLDRRLDARTFRAAVRRRDELRRRGAVPEAAVDRWTRYVGGDRHHHRSVRLAGLLRHRGLRLGPVLQRPRHHLGDPDSQRGAAREPLRAQQNALAEEWGSAITGENWKPNENSSERQPSAAG
jgi:hypothetical protein